MLEIRYIRKYGHPLICLYYSRQLSSSLFSSSSSSSFFFQPIYIIEKQDPYRTVYFYLISNRMDLFIYLDLYRV